MQAFDGRVGARVQPPLRVLGAVEILSPAVPDPAVPDPAVPDAFGPGLAAPAPPPPAPPRARRALAALVIRAGSVAPADWLAEVIWGDDQPRHMDAALHTVMSRLRGRLREVGLADAVVSRNPGYLLRIEDDRCDATWFTALTDRARSGLSSDTIGAARDLDEALALWRGPAFAEFADEAFAVPEVARLTERRVAAREDRAEAALLLGRPAEAVDLAERVLAEQPLRERAAAQLMLALYRTGRQADALAAFRRHRTALGDELGLDPSAALVALETRILRRDRDLDLQGGTGAPPGTPATTAPDPTAPRRAAPIEPDGADAGTALGPARGNVERPRSPLIGRSDALAALLDRLRAHPLITLTGPGGVGKTRLALEAAWRARRSGRFTDGVWFVPLAGLQPGSPVDAAVQTTLGVQRVAGVPPLDRLVDYLRPQRLLLILDNCEHVLESVAMLCAAATAHCPQVTVLATSQAALRTSDETVIRVGPLAVSTGDAERGDHLSPAVALFLERAGAAGQQLVQTAGTRASVVELCRRLDGMPLSLQLAASRLGVLTPAQILERLPERFHLLRTADRFAADRHRTLQALVDWSYRLLSDPQRRLFDRVAVFRSPFDLDDAAAIGEQTPDEVVDILDDLESRSMIVAVPAEDGATMTFSLLDTLRSYGHQRLVERQELPAIRALHARRVVGWLQRHEADVRTDRSGATVAALRGRMDDLREAHRWALDHDLDLDLALVGALLEWSEFQVSAEFFSWAEDAAERSLQRSGRSGMHPHTGSHALDGAAGPTAVALAIAAGGARFRGDLGTARAWAERAIDLLPDAADPLRRYPLALLAEVNLFEGRFEDVRAPAAESRQLARDAGDPARDVMATLEVALAQAYGGDPDGALAELAAAWSRGSTPAVDGWVSYTTGEILLDTDPERAAGLLREAIARAEHVGDDFLRGVALSSAASLRARSPAPAQAVPLLREVVDHWHRVGNWTQQWTALRAVADVLTRLDRPESAALLLGAIRQRAREHPLFGDDARRVDDVEALLAERLGGPALARLLTTGAAASPEEVLRLVRDGLASLHGGVGAGAAEATGVDPMPSATEVAYRSKR